MSEAGLGTEEPGAKIDWKAHDELRHGFDQIGCLADRPEIQVLTAVAYSPHFDRPLRIVLLATTDFLDYVVLFSTDTEQPADQIAK